MKILMAKTAGFCFGVDRAVALAEQAAASGKPAVTLGPIIHNRHAVAHFEEMGVRVISSPAEATSRDTGIIRSHGVTRAVQAPVNNTFFIIHYLHANLCGGRGFCLLQKRKKYCIIY